MAECGGPEGQDWRADLGIANDLDAKDVGKTGTAVVAKGAEDEVLALLIEDEDAGEPGRIGLALRVRHAAGLGRTLSQQPGRRSSGRRGVDSLSGSGSSEGLDGR